MEDDLQGRHPQWKMTLLAGYRQNLLFNIAQTSWQNLKELEDVIKGRQPQSKMN